MRQSYPKAALRILTAGAAALVLTLLTLNVLATAAKPDVAYSQATRDQLGTTLAPGRAVQSSTASLVSQQEPITPTLDVRRRRPDQVREPTGPGHRPPTAM